MSDYSTNEMMTVAAARRLPDGAVCFVGIGLPSTAANLARLTHAPDVTLIYESGPIGARPDVLPLSIGDGELADTADTVVSTPEIFRYWLQGGRVDVGFLGAAQIDRHANLNTTVIGPYAAPRTRLPGAGGHRRSRPAPSRCSSSCANPHAASCPRWTSSPRSGIWTVAMRGSVPACPAPAPAWSSPTCA